MAASTSRATNDDSQLRSEQCVSASGKEWKKPDPGGTLKCAFCSLEEHYDYKGRKPPFARQIYFSEDCYVMKDPWSAPNKAQVLVIGGDCSLCEKSICLGCSIFYTKRFCRECANEKIDSFPSQLHTKIKNLKSEEKV